MMLGYTGSSRNLDEDGCREVENKVLKMIRCVLHVGWKDVGERVRHGVEWVVKGEHARDDGYASVCR